MENLKEVKKYFKEEILAEAKNLQKIAENKMQLTGKYEYPKYTNEQIEILQEGFFDRMKAKFKDKFTYDPNVKAIYAYIKEGGQGNLELRDYPYGTFPPELKKVGGNFSVANSKVEEFPGNMQVQEDFIITRTSIKSLGKGLRINGSLFISNCPDLDTLPAKITVGRSIAIKNTPIKEYPSNLNKVNGDLGLYRTSITSLPSGLSVIGSLDLRETPIEKIPDNTFVSKTMFVNKCPNIKSAANFGKNIKIGKWMTLKGTPLSSTLKTKEDVEGFLNDTGIELTAIDYGKKAPLVVKNASKQDVTADIGGKIRGKRSFTGGGGFGGQFGAGGRTASGSRKNSIFNIFREEVEQEELNENTVKDVIFALSLLEKHSK